MTDLKKVDQNTIKKKADLTNLPTKFIENNDTKLPNMTDLKKVYQTLKECIIKKADLTNLPTKFTEYNDTNLQNVTDLKKKEQTTNEFTMNNATLSNLPTKFTENNDTNLPNVTDLKKMLIKQQMNYLSITMIRSTYLPSLQKIVI